MLNRTQFNYFFLYRKIQCHLDLVPILFTGVFKIHNQTFFVLNSWVYGVMPGVCVLCASPKLLKFSSINKVKTLRSNWDVPNQPNSPNYWQQHKTKTKPEQRNFLKVERYPLQIKYMDFLISLEKL